MRRWGSPPYAGVPPAAALGDRRGAGAVRLPPGRPALGERVRRLHRPRGAPAPRAHPLHARQHARDGFLEVSVPYLVRRECMFGTGQLPKMEEDMYHCGVDDLFLIPTAEVPITNLYRDEVLAESDLPVRLVGESPCFRREAGTYGKETARPGARAPVRQGRDGEDRRSRRRPTTSSSRSPPPRRGSCRRSSCPTGSWLWPAATSRSPPPSATTWRHGRRRRIAGSRSPRAATSSRSRPAGSGCATATPRGSWSTRTRSTARGWPCRAIFVALLEVHQTEQGTVRVPAALRPYLDGLEELGPPPGR